MATLLKQISAFRTISSVSNMASHKYTSFVLPLLLILTSPSMRGSTITAEARRLLETTLPELPSIPDLLPDLPEPELPSLPNVELPDHFPTLPEFPALPKLPELPKLTFPTIPFLPKDIPFPSLTPSHSNP